MGKFSVKFVKRIKDYGYWELYAEGIRIGTYSVLEIAGKVSNNPEVCKMIRTAKFGEVIIGVASGIKDYNENISMKILSFLNAVVQTWTECSYEHF